MWRLSSQTSLWFSIILLCSWVIWQLHQRGLQRSVDRLPAGSLLVFNRVFTAGGTKAFVFSCPSLSLLISVSFLSESLSSSIHILFLSSPFFLFLPFSLSCVWQGYELMLSVLSVQAPLVSLKAETTTNKQTNKQTYKQTSKWLKPLPQDCKCLLLNKQKRGPSMNRECHQRHYRKKTLVRWKLCSEPFQSVHSICARALK